MKWMEPSKSKINPVMPPAQVAFKMEDLRERVLSSDSVQLVVDSKVNPMAVKRNSSWFSGYFNMCNTIAGAGILGFPYAFARTGWAIGVLFVFVAGAFSYMGMTFLSHAAMKTGFPSTLYSISRPMHKNAPVIMDFIIICMLFGAAVAYLIVIGDLMPAASNQLGASGLWLNRHFWVVSDKY